MVVCGGGGEVAVGEAAGKDLVDGHEAAGHREEHVRGGVLGEHLAAAAARHEGRAVAVHARDGDEPAALVKILEILNKAAAIYNKEKPTE